MACTIDFRRLDEGFGGKTLKRKRAEQESEKFNSVLPDDSSSEPQSMDLDAEIHQQAKRQAASSSENPDRPIAVRPTYAGVIAGKVSGRKWKDVRTRRASAVQVSRKGTTVEQRMKDREIKRAYKERMTELKEEIRRNKQEKRQRREEREKKKQENILRTGTKLQKITNPKTLKKIAKSKQRKLLKVVPEDFLSKNKASSGSQKSKK